MLTSRITSELGISIRVVMGASRRWWGELFLQNTGCKLSSGCQTINTEDINWIDKWSTRLSPPCRHRAVILCHASVNISLCRENVVELCSWMHLNVRSWTSERSTFPPSHPAKFGLWQRHCGTAVTQCFLAHTNPQEVLVKRIHLKQRDQLKIRNKDQSLFSKPHHTAEYKCCFTTGKSNMLEATQGNAVFVNCGAYIISGTKVLTF